jgi:hypothetical protein
MFSKTIVYKDFNGEKKSEVFYFHASKADLLEMVAEGETIMARLNRIIETQDSRAILHEFKAIVEMSCGLRSEDGARFIKSPEAKSHLMDSPAYDELLMELFTDQDAGADFIRKLLPEEMQKEMRAQMEKLSTTKTETVVQLPEDDRAPAWIREDRNPTDKELVEMPIDELQMAFRRRINKNIEQHG